MTADSNSNSVATRGGDFERALANGRALLANHPEVALSQAQTLLKIAREPRALRLAAAAYRALGRSDEAAAAEMGAIGASLSDPLHERAAQAQREGRNGEAIAMLAGVLANNPDNLLALTIGAEARLEHGDLERATQMLRSVLARAPGFLHATMVLAKALQTDAQIGAAIELLEEVVARHPDLPEVLHFLSELSAEAGNYDRAAGLCQRLLTLDPRQTHQWIVYAHYLRILGRKEDSKAAFRQAIELEPHKGAAWWGLANYFPDDLTDDDLVQIRRAMKDRGNDDNNSSALRIALGLSADRRGAYGEAFKQLKAGKTQRRNLRPREPAHLTAEVDESITIFSPQFYLAHRSAAFADASPIFLLGMHRSGSTLVERILGGHSAIEGAGELTVFPRLVEILQTRAADEGGFGNFMRSISSAEVTELGQWYVERSRGFRHSDKPYFIDKLNANWRHVGLIRLILPNARILDVRRRAVDCCWANYKMLFDEAHPASNDLAHIGRFYRDYVRLMDAIDIAAPGGILTVGYENLIDNVAFQTQRIMDFIGVDYEPEALAFHRSTQPVATASSEQVRRPLNRDSIGSAGPYRRWLGPLIRELGPLARFE